ncbi:MAG: hypothetical protein KF902_03470 [Phycisphaeraceae bacterium]|nr:hypothetical protein [Phycisphaeraceae bacterium]MCW5769388.1 hypothetical protein [Phycisphaeraceae bacterium]
MLGSRAPGPVVVMGLAGEVRGPTPFCAGPMSTDGWACAPALDEQITITANSPMFNIIAST